MAHLLRKSKGNVANAELGSETCDNHKWCDAGLGDLIVIVKSTVFLFRICNC